VGTARRATLPRLPAGHCLAVARATAAAAALLRLQPRQLLLLTPCVRPCARQAAGRIHRLGQTKDIFVKRYAFKGTIEEAIIALHEKIKSGEVKVVDGTMPPSANRVMADASASTTQHELTGPVHDATSTGDEDPCHARLLLKPNGWREVYRASNKWTRKYQMQECAVCGTCRDVSGSSTWSGTGVYAYLEGLMRDPPRSYDSPTSGHFKPQGSGRFGRMPRPPDGWLGLQAYSLNNGEATPAGGFGVATPPPLEALVMAIAQAFVDKARENGASLDLGARMAGVDALDRASSMSSRVPTELGLSVGTLRGMLDNRVASQPRGELTQELLWYVDAGIEQACTTMDTQHWTVLHKLKPDVLTRLNEQIKKRGGGSGSGGGGGSGSGSRD
jgi:hypothetical protein